MPIESHVNAREPSDNAVIWRFMNMRKFRDLMASEELYFCRADLYKQDDPNEGLPSDDYVRSARGFVKYDLNDEQTLNNDQATNRQFSESFYLNCWQLYEGETLHMWKTYGEVAICSHYGLLKAALDGMLDVMHLGLVQYGDGHVTRYNVLEFIYNKRFAFDKEREVRAVLCCRDPMAGLNRHFNDLNFPNREPLDAINPIHEWVPKYKRRRVDMKLLLKEVVVGPWARDEEIEEVNLWLKVKNFACSVKRSGLTGNLTPKPEDLKRFGI
jgi:hypothetical protein